MGQEGRLGDRKEGLLVVMLGDIRDLKLEIHIMTEKQKVILEYPGTGWGSGLMPLLARSGA